MVAALCQHLRHEPDKDLDEMAWWLWSRYQVTASRWTISRALSSAGWSRKTVRRIAKGRNADLRDYYMHQVSEYASFQRVYVDESGCDKRIGARRYGWAPRGVTPAKIAPFHRGRRYQILAAYGQDGIVHARVVQDNVDAAFFVDFVEQLLMHCNPFPGRNSVLILDNASFHRTDAVQQVCARAGVKVVFLAPYSPDQNPIEEFFAELKAFTKKHWAAFEQSPELRFESFLEWCIDEVGTRKESARGHFRHAGVSIDEL